MARRAGKHQVLKLSRPISLRSHESTVVCLSSSLAVSLSRTVPPPFWTSFWTFQQNERRKPRPVAGKFAAQRGVGGTDATIGLRVLMELLVL